MKTNAIIRIIIWSLVILLLSAILAGGLLGGHVLRSVFRIFSGEDTTWVATTPARIDSGETPVETQLPVRPLEPENTLTLPATDIRNIEIEWVAGKILIQPMDVPEITFSESDVTDIKNALAWEHRNNTLSIYFCEDAIHNFIGFGNNTKLTKDLTIYVPKDWTCDSLEIDAASASLEVNDLTIREVDIDTASGACKFDNCSVKELDLDTASGDIRFYGFLDILDCDAASANFYAILTNIPTRMDMDSMSGDLDITLPESAGFTASVEGLSAKFTSDFDTITRNGNHVHGDGHCRISVDAVSGDVTIRKAAEPPVAETIVPAEIPGENAHHEHTDSCTTDPDSCPDNNIHHDYSGDDIPAGTQSTHETTHHEEAHHS